MTIALYLPTLETTTDEAALIDFHLKRLASFTIENKGKEAYYEGKHRFRQLGISIPPSLANIETVVGWPGTAVDTLEERLDWLGWADDDDRLGLREIYDANSLDIDSGTGHLDSLITGTAFVIVGKGGDSEPDPLITVESPHRVTGLWDGRLRRLSSALSIDEQDPHTGEASLITLYLPHEDITYGRPYKGGSWRVVERVRHNLGRVLVAQLVNRPRASHLGGRSEITPAIRTYTDEAARTILGMSINREFFNAPQRAVFGASKDDFVNAGGDTMTGWEAVMGRFLAVPRDEDGELPVPHEWKANSPAPYLDQIRGLSEMLAAEAGIPATYLGFSNENPPSADAIRAMEARLVKRAERRQTSAGRAWREVGALALLVRDGELDPDYSKVGLQWRDAATPTRAADTDAAVKLVQSGVLPPTSPVTYTRLGFTQTEQRALASEARRDRSRATMTAIAQAAAALGPEEEGTEEVTDGSNGA